MSNRKCIGLVVPGLHQGGGVPAVAEFIHGVISESVQWSIRVVSLCMSSRDSESTSLFKPSEWLSLPKSGFRLWMSRDVTFVGARFGEVEFQRYMPRSSLEPILRGCDLIQVVAGSPAWANSVIGLGKPVSLQVATRAKVERLQRDSSGKGALGLWRRGMTHITDRLDDRALRLVDAIQVENPWMLDYSQQINEDRPGVDICYAPPGIDCDVFRPASERNLMADPYILCVGRLNDPRKRAELLLEAFALVAQGTCGHVRLVLAGADAPLTAFWARAKALQLRDRITYVSKPDRATLVSLYQQAAVFALPSDEEGFGMVVIEAMACGVPVVATRCGGPDGIIKDGVDGLLVPRNDALAMTNGLNQVLTDMELNRDMGKAARATVERRYDRKVAGAEFLNIWHRLLEGRC